MKRLLLLLVVVVFLPCQAAHAQAAVLAAATDAILFESGLAQALYYAQTASQIIATAQSTAAMLTNMGEQAQRQVDNLQNIGKIRSYDDFMNWYNRQLYLERMTEETWNNMNVTIGKKNYKLTDVEGIAYGLKDTYIDYWDKEFTEEQNREMWLRLGMTPSNYVYVQTWKEREKEIARQFLASREIKNKEYMEAMERDDELLNLLAEDAEKPDDEKLGDKGVAAVTAEMSIHNNKTLHDISMTLAQMQEQKAIEMYQKNTPFDQPAVSEDFDKTYFRPLK